MMVSARFHITVGVLIAMYALCTAVAAPMPEIHSSGETSTAEPATTTEAAALAAIEATPAAAPAADLQAVINNAVTELNSIQQELMDAVSASGGAGLNVGAAAPVEAAVTSTSGGATIASVPLASDGLGSVGSTPVHNVTIGDGFTRFTPAIIKANPGDVLMFNWVGKNNHSVTESDALGSCEKSTSPTAFDSGVQPPGTTWNLTIPADAKGLKFFYCKVGKHCLSGGMSATIVVPG